MKIIGENYEYTNRIESLYELYKSVVQIKIPSEFESTFVIKITSEFKKDLYLQSSEKAKLEMDKEGVPELNGIVIMPNNEDLDFTVLISSKQFEDDQIVHTAIHEFTHLYDYYQYFKENGNVYIRDEKEKESKYFYEFYHWSEYHSKRLGNLIFSIYKWHEINEKPPDGIYSFQEVKFFSENLVGKIRLFNQAQKSNSSHTSYLFWDLFIELMRYYGRLSVFQGKDLYKFPDEKFPEEILIDTLGIECIKLYHLLLQMDTYETAMKRLMEFKELKESIIVSIRT